MARGSATSRADQAANAKALDAMARRIGRILNEGYSGAASRQVLTSVGVLVSNAIKKELSQPGSGETYGNHQASAPGEPPAVDTGRLRSSYTWSLGVDAHGEFVEVGTNVVYAPFLEYGTSKMAPRPHFRPALEAAAIPIREMIERGLSRTVTEAAHRNGAR